MKRGISWIPACLRRISSRDIWITLELSTESENQHSNTAEVYHHLNNMETKQALHTDYIEIYATPILLFSEIISLSVEQYVIMV